VGEEGGVKGGREGGHEGRETRRDGGREEMEGVSGWEGEWEGKFYRAASSRCKIKENTIFTDTPMLCFEDGNPGYPWAFAT